MWYFLPFIAIESPRVLGINYKASQTLYLFQVLLPIILLFLISRKKKIYFTPISSSLALYAIYLVFVSLIALIFLPDIISFKAFLRQLMSLIIGLLTFVALRNIFTFSRDSDIYKGILAAFFVIILFAVSRGEFLRGEFYRIRATFTEPSHLAYDLVSIYLFVLVNMPFQSRRLKVCLFVLWSVVFVLTYSGSGYVSLLIFLTVLFVQFLAKFKIKHLLLTTLFMLFTIIVYCTLFSESYVSRILMATVGNLSDLTKIPVSVTDRLQVLIMMSDIKLIEAKDFLLLFFGSGMGSDSRIAQLLPRGIYANIVSVKGYGSFLSSALSKVYVYSGIAGMTLYLFYFMKLIKTSRILSRKNIISKYSEGFIWTLLAMTFYTFGPYSSMALWFIPAFLDAKYIGYLHNRSKIEK